MQINLQSMTVGDAIPCSTHSLKSLLQWVEPSIASDSCEIHTHFCSVESVVICIYDMFFLEICPQGPETNHDSVFVDCINKAIMLLKFPSVRN